MANNLFAAQTIGVHATGTSPAEVIAVAQQAERAGWHGISVGDSAYDTFAMLSAIAATTSRIRMRSGVALMSRSPVQTVQAASTIDQLSLGRFRLGLGSGSRERSAGWHNLNYSKPVGLLRDFVAAFRHAWASPVGQPVSYSGEFFHYSNAAILRPHHTARLPIDIGANSPQMLSLAGQIADGVIINDLHGGSYLRSTALPRVALGEQKAGRPSGTVRRIGSLLIAIARTRAAALDRGRYGVGYYLMISHNRDVLDYHGLPSVRATLEAALAAGDTEGFFRAIPDAVVERFAVCGDRDHCRSIIASHADALDEVILHIPEWRTPGDAARAAYEELIDVMAPA